MSLREIATEMKKKGRGPDTELVHMAPREVAGLRALAKAHGGDLTTNPDTGLPEAGFLESILPTLVGAGLAVVSGGTLIPVMAAAATGAMMNKDDPLMGAVTGGMGGFGGAGITNAFAGAAGAAGSAGTAAAAGTAEAATTEAAKQAALDAAMQQQAQQELAAQAAQQTGQEVATNQVADQATQAAARDIAQEQVAQQAAQPYYAKVGEGAKNVFTGQEGAAESFVGKPATATSEATGLGGWKGAGDYAMKAAAPLLAAQGQQQGSGGTADARGIMTSMREGNAPINLRMSEMGEDEAFNAAKRKAASPGGSGAGLGALDSFNKRPWYYEQKAQGGILRLDSGGLSISSSPQTNSAIMPYGGGESGLGLAALASRVKRYQTPLEDQLAAMAAATAPVVAPAAAAPMGDPNFKGGGGSSTNDKYVYAPSDGTGEGDAGAPDGGEGDLAGLGFAGGGILSLAKGGLAQGGFVFSSDVVSALGNGSTDAGLRALTQQYGAVTPLKGHGDGFSDSIPTSVDGQRPARVADGEAYVPPETVAQIGGGDHAKGAKMLYSVMERVRKAAHGKSSQQREVVPERVLA